MEIKELVEKGESETLEFKKSTAQLEKSLRSICAFLNHKGGEIYFGIDKNGKIIGQDISDNTIRSISQKIRQRIKPEVTPAVNVLEIDEKKMIEIKVKEGNNKPYYLGGIAYKRVGTENPVITPEELERLILEKKKKYWDSEICEGVSLEDIDKEKVKWFLRKAKYERNFDVEPETPVEEALERLGLMKNEKLTNAAVLLFDKNPQKFFLQAETRCARFKGTKPLEFIDMKVFQGSITDQVEKSLSFVLEHIPMRVYITGKPEREEKYEYPPDAIREAIINAICHRDYEIQSNVQIRIFDDRIEVWGCGPLPEPLTPEDLKKKHGSILRNPLIGRCFFLIKYIEEWGTGTNRIVEWCLKHGLPEPVFEEATGSFVITFRKYKVSEEIMKVLSNEERVVINFIKENGKISRKECVELLNISSTTAFRHFKSLEKKKILKRIGKGKNVYYILA